MPFLRRRGNMASETDIRRYTLFDETQTMSSNDDALTGPILPASQPAVLEDTSLPSQQYALRSENTELGSERSVTDPERQNKLRRFSIMRYRNASDSQLSLRSKQQAEITPPIPQPPAIITTAPTNDLAKPRKMASRMNIAAKFRRSSDISRDENIRDHGSGKYTSRKLQTDEGASQSTMNVNEQGHHRPSTQATTAWSNTSPSTYNHRQSESSRSDVSSADRNCQVNQGTTPKKSQITAPFLKLRRKKRPQQSLFPLAHLPQKNGSQNKNLSSASLAVAYARPASSQSATTPRAGNGASEDSQFTHSSAAATLLSRGSTHRSGQSSPTRANLLRGRSSTMSSARRDSQEDHLVPPATRTSTSTGRKSFGDLFGLGRIRQNSELSRQGTLTPATPGSNGSKSNSLQLPRDSIVLPERLDDESPAKYLARVEGVVSRGTIASALAKGTDAFSTTVLRSYMRSFSFFGDPMDMAIRKLLMEAELPKETQQIDRCLQAFANRYHECNPGIYSTPDQAYFIAFSLLILHTDVFNKNNKHKMQKSDYLKNTRGEGIFDDILGCFYDNISYTPFIYVEDDLDLASERTQVSKSKRKQILPGNVVDPAKRAAKEPIDPYTLILDGNLDALRPNIKDAMHLDDHYNYLGTAPSLNLKDLQNTFFKTGVLQIVSARSRPDAFMSERTATNPNDAHPGIVDIKVTKVGLLWRKDAKKRKTRSPWQEWGAILTGAQLYFFRNTSWVKSLIHQHENHLKGGHDGIPVIFDPPLEEFKPDVLMSTHAAVALLDTTYKKHKNAFVYVRQGGLDEILLAESEEERNDWLAKLNYAAAFRTSGVRMRGVVGSNYDGQGRRGIRRLDSSDATQMIETPTGLVSIARGRIDKKMAEDIQVARRDGIQQKIFEADKKVDECQKKLEEQLRNARHLQILAPIQPRTREHLLLAAARLSAQLKWTRMDIWRERCHRDILIQDLADDEAILHNANRQSDLSNSTPTSKPLVSRTESKSRGPTAAERNPQTPTTDSSLSHISSSIGNNQDIDSPTKAASRPSPHSVTKEATYTPPPGPVATTRHGSVSSVDTSTNQKPSPAASQYNPAQDAESVAASQASDNQDDVDADERDFLKQAGLWEARSRQNTLDKTSISASAEGPEHAPPADRDKIERSKIRRSLQRTLRESAGHLSHHRSKKGSVAGTLSSGSLDDVPQEAMLSRGTGSFVVHGKKASVINLGTELQTLSQDDKILSRKQPQLLQSEQIPASLFLSDEHDDDYLSALEAPSESNDSNSRRGSAASASTTTARSFKQLHRKYSSAQAVRSPSGAMLVIPSDGESEMAISLTDGRKSTQLTPEREIDGDAERSYSNSEGSVRLEEGTKVASKNDENDGSDDVEASAQHDRDAFSSHSIQAVTV
ncbi:hypothetical protein C2857_001971 [Epichloe festucae Fl1]|uniref:Guanyl-nucleotide exchange factor n=1 Tax=Epichloe festucae (strain Fl1) TaxID=877507 RepID=A0A7U3SND4_EPIFF|nr:hypothetical protein C2857_001971 [Epichloe festucae Fl1]